MLSQENHSPCFDFEHQADWVTVNGIDTFLAASEHAKSDSNQTSSSLWEMQPIERLIAYRKFVSLVSKVWLYDINDVWLTLHCHRYFPRTPLYIHSSSSTTQSIGYVRHPSSSSWILPARNTPLTTGTRHSVQLHHDPFLLDFPKSSPQFRVPERP